MLRVLGSLAFVALLAFSAPAGASSLVQAAAPASEAYCPAGTIPLGPFCVLWPLGGGPGYCPAGTIKVGPFCVIWPF